MKLFGLMIVCFLYMSCVMVEWVHSEAEKEFLVYTELVVFFWRGGVGGIDF